MKSEIRNPKVERNPEPETRNGAWEWIALRLPPCGDVIAVHPKGVKVYQPRASESASAALGSNVQDRSAHPEGVRVH